MKPIVDILKDELDSVIDKYRDQGLTMGEAIGAIEMLKLDLFLENKNYAENY